MSSVEQITTELLSIDFDISTYEVRLQRERGEITNTMNKAQSTFGDQQAGQILVTTLYRTLQNIVTADSSLHLVRQEIHDCVQNMQK